MTGIKTSPHTLLGHHSGLWSTVIMGLSEFSGLLEEANFITLLRTLRFSKCGYSIGASECQEPDAFKGREREGEEEVG